MRTISKEQLAEIIESHGRWNIDSKAGERADLHFADLSNADLDFSQLPLWCGSFDIKVDKRIAVQVLYHFCRLSCKDIDVIEAQKQVRELANQFHRVNECGILKD